MNIVPPAEPWSMQALLDEVRWQCANNEGWPDREAARVVRVPGAVAPVIALAVPSNVVDLNTWRMAQATSRRESTGH